MSVTLPTETLRRAVLSVATAAAKKGDHAAALAGVRMLVDDGRLSVVATDRFALHLAEVDVVGSLDVLADAAQLLRAVKAIKPAKVGPSLAALARLDVDERSMLTIEHGWGDPETGLDRVDGVAVVPTLDGDFPTYRTLFPAALVAEQPSALVGVSPQLLARTATAAGHVLALNSPVRFWTPPARLVDGVPVLDAGATRPIVLTAADEGLQLQWRALLMPVRVAS